MFACYSKVQARRASEWFVCTTSQSSADKKKNVVQYAAEPLACAFRVGLVLVFTITELTTRATNHLYAADDGFVSAPSFSSWRPDVAALLAWMAWSFSEPQALCEPIRSFHEVSSNSQRRFAPDRENGGSLRSARLSLRYGGRIFLPDVIERLQEGG